MRKTKKPVWVDKKSYETVAPTIFSDMEKKKIIARWVMLGKPSKRKEDGLPIDAQGLCDYLDLSERQLAIWMEDPDVLAEQKRLYQLIWQKVGAERTEKLVDLYFSSLQQDPSAARWRLEFERTGQIGKGAAVNVNVQNNTQIRSETHIIDAQGAKDHLLSLLKEQPEVRERVYGLLQAALTSDGRSDPNNISGAVVVRESRPNGRSASRDADG